MNEAIVDSMVVNGFKNIVLMGEHGGDKKLRCRENQRELRGVHVFFCGDLRNPSASRAVADREPSAPSSHGGIPDTSLMMYLGGDAGCARTSWWPASVLPLGTPPDPIDRA